MFKNGQTGFIQAPLLVVIALMVMGSVGTSVVLHKQGRSLPLVATISEAFKSRPKEIPESKKSEDTTNPRQETTITPPPQAQTQLNSGGQQDLGDIKSQLEEDDRKNKALQEELNRQRETEKQQSLERQKNQRNVEEQRTRELLSQKNEISGRLTYFSNQKARVESSYSSVIANLEEQKNLELERLESDYRRELDSLVNNLASRGLALSGVRIKAENDLLADYNLSKKQTESYYQGKINSLASERENQMLLIEREIDKLTNLLRQIDQALLNR